MTEVINCLRSPSTILHAKHIFGVVICSLLKQIVVITGLTCIILSETVSEGIKDNTSAFNSGINMVNNFVR